MDIYIEPTNVSFDIVKVTYEIKRLIPNHSCEISAFLTESNGNRIKRYNLVLAEPEYSQWGTDDTFLVDWICIQCGVKKAPVVEVEQPVQNETPVAETVQSDEPQPAQNETPTETQPAP